MNLEDYIVVSDQLLSDTALDEIRSLLVDLNWKPATTFGDFQDYRTCSIFPISSAMQPQLRRIDGMLFEVVSAGGLFYKKSFPDFSFKTDTGYDILRYEQGQFYKRHTDHFENVPRSLAFSLGLNNDYEGGEFSFCSLDFEVKVKAGHAIMFPANFMFPHEIKPVTAGTRYSMITWFM
jgi:predicted 2-oxoglutarate/Fe(II)-dependent dioxygenase YbiX